jgi:hypothetical protein
MVTPGAGAGSEAESARAAERADNETRAATLNAIAEVRETLQVIVTSFV